MPNAITRASAVNTTEPALYAKAVTLSDTVNFSVDHNLLTYSEQLNNAAWTKTNVTVVADEVLDPNGNPLADALTASANNGTITETLTLAAVPYTFSIWLKRKTGSGNIQLSVDGTTYATVSITTSWARYETTLTPTAGSKTPGIKIATSADAVYAWGAQLEANTATATTYQRIVTQNNAIARGLYIGTGGNAVLVLDDGITTCTFNNLISGTILPVRCSRVNATNTTASNIVALF